MRDNVYSAGMRKEAGFTLVEVAIILTVLGLVLGPFFGYLSSQYLKRNLIQQHDRREAIMSALAVFVAENDRYPCPANPGLGPTSVDFGVENCSVISSGSMVNNIRAFDGNLSMLASSFNRQVYVGALPVATLRLPPNFIANGDGWKYFYVISANLMSTGTNSVGAITVFVDSDKDNITGVDDSGTVLDPGDARLNNVHFVVVDPGKLGRGAYAYEGVLGGFLCDNTLAGDYRNCSFSVDGTNLTEFRDMQFSDSGDVNSPNYYDDFIFYSLAMDETTYWEIQDNINQDGTVNITTRADGNVGIGTTMPRERMHVVGGNLRVNGTESGGSVSIEDIEANDASVDLPNGGLDAGKMLGTRDGFYYNTP